MGEERKNTKILLKIKNIDMLSIAKFFFLNLAVKKNSKLVIDAFLLYLVVFQYPLRFAANFIFFAL